MQSNNSNDESKDNSATGRGKPCKERPWAWIEKAIVRMIRDVFDATNDVALALALYLALTEIASDEQSDTFTKPISEIAKRAGMSYRKAWSILQRFLALKIITIQCNTVTGTKLQSPSTYTLCTACISLCTDAEHSSKPRLKKKREESQKNVVEESARGTAAATTTAVAESEKEKETRLEKIAQQVGNDPKQLCEALQPHLPQMDLPRELEKYTAWMAKRSKTPPTPSGFVRSWIMRVQPTLAPLPRKGSGNNGAKPQPDGWLQWLKATYPDARVCDFWRAPDDVKAEFKRATGSSPEPNLLTDSMNPKTKERLASRKGAAEATSSALRQ